MSSRIIFITGFTVCAIVHAAGMFLLFKVKSKPKSQRIITFNLALVEFLYSIFHIYENTKAMVTGINWMLNLKYPEVMIMVLFLTMIRFIMFYLMFDRFLDIKLHMRYQVYFTSQKVIFVLKMMWLVSAALALTVMLLNHFAYSLLTLQAFCVLMFIVMDIIVAVNWIMTYLYLYHKTKQLIRKESRLRSTIRTKSRGDRRNSKWKIRMTSLKRREPHTVVAKTTSSETIVSASDVDNNHMTTPGIHRKITVSNVDDRTLTISNLKDRSKNISHVEVPAPYNKPRKSKFKVPFLLVTTYIICNVTSMISVMFYLQKPRDWPYIAIFGRICEFLVLFGFLSDAIIYVFIQKDIRRTWLAWLKRFSPLRS